MSAQRFDPDTLIAAACELAGSDDFGDFGFGDSWRDGFARLTGGLAPGPGLPPLGVEPAWGATLRALATRVQIGAGRAEHPGGARGGTARPIVIVGQPRTAPPTLYDLRAQAPELRPP